MHHEVLEFVACPRVLPIVSWASPVVSSQVRTTAAPHSIAHDRRVVRVPGSMDFAPVLVDVTTLDVSHAGYRVVNPAIPAIAGGQLPCWSSGWRFGISDGKVVSGVGPAVGNPVGVVERNLRLGRARGGGAAAPGGRP